MSHDTTYLKDFNLNLQFILPQELSIILEPQFMSQITKDNPTVIQQAEETALEMIKDYLRGRYDIEFELRPYIYYSLNEEYGDFERVAIKSNQDIEDFEDKWGIETISHNIDEPYLLIKKENTCPDEYLKKLYENYYKYKVKYKTSNPEYDNTCGVIQASNGTVNTDRIINYYSTEYSTSGTNFITSSIDFSTKTVSETNNIIGNYDYFDQYRLSNKDRDFLKDDRNQTLKRITLDLMKYEIFQRTAPNNLNQIVADRRDTSIEHLDKICKGYLSPDLKIYEETEKINNYSPIQIVKNRNAFRDDY